MYIMYLLYDRRILNSPDGRTNNMQCHIMPHSYEIFARWQTNSMKRLRSDVPLPQRTKCSLATRVRNIMFERNNKQTNERMHVKAKYCRGWVCIYGLSVPPNISWFFSNRIARALAYIVYLAHKARIFDIRHLYLTHVFSLFHKILIICFLPNTSVVHQYIKLQPTTSVWGDLSYTCVQHFPSRRSKYTPP